MSVVRKITIIVGEHVTLSDYCGQSSLWTKKLWIVFALGKVLVRSSWIRIIRLGIPFCLQNKNIVG